MDVNVLIESLPRDQLLLLLTLILSLCLSSIYYVFLVHSENRQAKQLYFFVIGHLFLSINYGWLRLDILHIYVPVMATYAFSRYFRGKIWMPWVMFFSTMLHLSYIHLRRQFASADSHEKYALDISGPIMMMVIKLTSFAFDMNDSALWAKRPVIANSPPRPVEAASENISKASPVDNRTKFSELEEYPSVLEFLGYCLLFPGLITGPIVPFYDYRTFIDGKYFKGIDHVAGAIEGRKRRVAFVLGQAAVFLVLYVAIAPYFPTEKLVAADLRNPKRGFGIPFVAIYGLFARFKFYAVWLLAEGSYVLSGLGFRTSSTGKPLWDRFANVNPWIIETTADFRTIVAQWNISVNRWLHSYIYRKVQKILGKNKTSSTANLATYVVSAWWHGFYPGYYLGFLTGAWMSVLSRYTSSKFSQFKKHTAFKVIFSIFLHIMLTYALMPMVLLDFQRGWFFWKSIYFLGHTVLATIQIFMFVETYILPRKNAAAPEVAKVDL